MGRISGIGDWLVVHAAVTLIPCGQTNPDTGVVDKPCDYNGFLLLLKNVFDYLVLIAVPLATVAIVYAGIIMVTAGGNDGKRSQAKDIIWTAVKGLVLVLAAYLIVRTIFQALTQGEFKELFK